MSCHNADMSSIWPAAATTKRTANLKCKLHDMRFSGISSNTAEQSSVTLLLSVSNIMLNIQTFSYTIWKLLFTDAVLSECSTLYRSLFLLHMEAEGI